MRRFFRTGSHRAEEITDLSAAKRYHYVLRGRVQNVGFRYMAVGIARELGLTGWVKNDYDGAVSMEIQGLPERISQFFVELSKDRYIQIQDIQQEEQTPVAERGFHVRY